MLVRSGFARRSGVFSRVSLDTGAIQVASEVAHYPFAFPLAFGDGYSERRGVIEHFARLGPDEQRELWLYSGRLRGDEVPR